MFVRDALDDLEQRLDLVPPPVVVDQVQAVGDVVEVGIRPRALRLGRVEEPLADDAAEQPVPRQHLELVLAADRQRCGVRPVRYAKGNLDGDDRDSGLNRRDDGPGGEIDETKAADLLGLGDCNLSTLLVDLELVLGKPL